MTFSLDLNSMSTDELISIRDELDNELAKRRASKPIMQPRNDTKTYYVSCAHLELCVHARVSPLLQSRALRDLIANRFPNLKPFMSSTVLPSTSHQYAYMRRHEPTRTIEIEL